MTTKPNANDIIGYDDSSSMHDIRATCAACEEAHPCGGPAIFALANAGPGDGEETPRGESWLNGRVACSIS